MPLTKKEIATLEKLKRQYDDAVTREYAYIHQEKTRLQQKFIRLDDLINTSKFQGRFKDTKEKTPLLRFDSTEEKYFLRIYGEYTQTQESLKNLESLTQSYKNEYRGMNEWFETSKSADSRSAIVSPPPNRFFRSTQKVLDRATAFIQSQPDPYSVRSTVGRWIKSFFSPSPSKGISTAIEAKDPASVKDLPMAKAQWARQPETSVPQEVKELREEIPTMHAAYEAEVLLHKLYSDNASREVSLHSSEGSVVTALDNTLEEKRASRPTSPLPMIKEGDRDSLGYSTRPSE